jgi:hypothetical protein
MKLFLLFASMLVIFPAESNAGQNPDEVTLAFYRSYLNYQAGLAGKARSPEEAAAADMQATKKYLTAGYWRMLVAQKKKCSESKDSVLPGCDSDSFFCAQEPPTSATIAKSEKVNFNIFKGKSISLPVALCFNCRPENSHADQQTRVVQVHLLKTIGNWLIEKIDCSPAK